MFSRSVAVAIEEKPEFMQFIKCTRHSRESCLISHEAKFSFGLTLVAAERFNYLNGRFSMRGISSLKMADEHTRLMSIPADDRWHDLSMY